MKANKLRGKKLNSNKPLDTTRGLTALGDAPVVESFLKPSNNSNSTQNSPIVESTMTELDNENYD